MGKGFFIDVSLGGGAQTRMYLDDSQVKKMVDKVSAGRETVDRLLSDFSESPEVSYYQFPEGIEVRQISAHLTSFGGQALQYIARSCRLDGNNKGEQVSDLKKVIDFCNWEIERLENAAN